jgi:hypothetical protein
LNDDGLGVNQLRLRKVADVDAAVLARLANAHRDSDVGGQRRGRHTGSHPQQRKYATIHVENLTRAHLAG